MRVLPDRCDAVVTRGAWDEPRIFAEIQQAGAVSDEEMENVFNLGLGMLAVVPPDAALHAVDIVRAAGHDAWLVGEIVDGHGSARPTRNAADASSAWQLLQPVRADPGPLRRTRGTSCAG